MKINDYKDEYQKNSAKGSDVARQLSFAGIAIIWIFKIQDQTIPKIPEHLILPLILFCASLFFDLLQYILGYGIWFSVYKYHEIKQTPDNLDLQHCNILPIILHACMIVKIISVISAYVLIFNYLITIWT